MLVKTLAIRGLELKQTDLGVVIVLVIFSLVGIVVCIRTLLRLNSSEASNSSDPRRLKTAKIYFSVALFCALFMFGFLSFQLFKFYSKM